MLRLSLETPMLDRQGHHHLQLALLVLPSKANKVHNNSNNPE